MTGSSRGWRAGLGPVFAYEWIALARRWQWYALRSMFVGSLLVAMLVILLNSPEPMDQMSFRLLPRLGQWFFTAVIGTQLTLVLLAAPAATAGSICIDRATGKLTLILVTDLSDSEIVLGKLASRLVPVLGLIACALPFLAILTLLGGIDPDALLGAFAVTIGLAVLGCSLALAISLRARKPHEALLATYSVWGIWLLSGPAIRFVNAAYGLALSIPSPMSDPFQLAFAPYLAPRSVRFGDYAWFLATTSGISILLVALSISRFRSVCTREDVPKTKSVRGRVERFVAWIDPVRHLPGPSLDVNPVLWREWHRTRASSWGRIAGAVFLIGAVVGTIGAIISPPMSFAAAWVNGLQVAIGMLLLSVTASTSLAEERIRGGLDVLMCTALSTRQIVLGKWMGSFRRVPVLALLPMLVVGCGDRSKWFYLPTVVITPLFVLVCAAAVSALGLAMATWNTRVGRASAFTVSAYVLVAVGWLFIAMWTRMGTSDEGLMMASPFFFAGELAADLCNSGSDRSHIGWALSWLAIYGLAAAGLLAATLGTFNRCVGRVEFGASPWRRPHQGSKSGR